MNFQSTRIPKSVQESLIANWNVRSIWVDKWNVVLDLRKLGPSAEVLAKFKAVKKRQKPLELGECARSWQHLATISKNFELARFIFLGRRLQLIEETTRTFLRQLKWSVNLWMDVRKRNKTLVIDTLSAMVVRTMSLNLANSTKTLANTLFRFYKPARLAHLFSELFPDRYWDPTRSPLVIHQAKRRLRDWLKENKFLLQLTIVR